MQELSDSTDFGSTGFRSRTDGWPLWKKAVLLIFYVTVIIGVVSFLTFYASFVAEIANSSFFFHEPLLIVLIFGGSLSQLAGWGFIAWYVHTRDDVVRAAAIAIVPLMFTSLPFGILGYSELTRERAPQSPVVF